MNFSSKRMLRSAGIGGKGLEVPPRYYEFGNALGFPVVLQFIKIGFSSAQGIKIGNLFR